MQLRNVRFIIAAITTLSAYAVYVSRVNLSIAIIAMVEDHHQSAAGHTKLSPHHQVTTQRNNYTEASPTTTSDYTTSYPLDDYGEKLTTTGAPTSAKQTAANASTDASQKHRDPITVMFLNSKKTFHLPLIKQDKFQWDPVEQGHILGAFFYGYIMFQVPGARMAESVGAKWIIMAASAGSAVISLAFPLSTQLNSIHLLMALRFVLGLCQSAFFPASYVLYCRWLPESERSVLLPIMFIGGNVGSISTYIMSSYLISSSYGWPSVFYLSGFICSLCSVLWLIFGSNEPSNNWLITHDELSFIESNINSQTSESNSLSEELSLGVTASPAAAINCGDDGAGKTAKKQSAALSVLLDPRDERKSPPNGLKSCCQEMSAKGEEEFSLNNDKHDNLANDSKRRPARAAEPPISWTKLATSVPVWTLILSMYGNEWSHAVICYELPTYLNTALAYPIEQNGVINSFFQLSYAVASPIMCSLGAYMLDRHLFGMRKIHVRKLFQSLATFGQFACFLSVPICGANRGLIIMLMFSAVIFKSCANAGDIMVSGDLSPEYAGTIYACANSIGNTAGFGVPLLAGLVLGDYSRDREQWTPFWLITATIMFASGLIFLVFGETRPQNFAKCNTGGARGCELEMKMKRATEAQSISPNTRNTAPTQVDESHGGSWV